ncbi:MAG: FlgD immunoglobulin-like domain containing protein [Candidatus Marinimicrobia bacterium]|nr:FlgD immunoglobulin-like domain containing protein [Candidatus Neomarinimicrobiota bacterium]
MRIGFAFFFSILIFLPVLIRADVPFSIIDLTLVGETDLRQCVNHQLEFKWQYSKPIPECLVEMILSEVFTKGDTVFWESGTVTMDQPGFQYVSLGDIRDGAKYRFSIRAKDPDAEWSDYATLEFEMNSVPAKPAIVTTRDFISRQNEMELKFTPAADKQVKPSGIRYQIKLTSDSLGKNILFDQTVAPLMSKDMNLYHKIRQPLPENSACYAWVRAWDGVENSPWSEYLKFFINRINEPPGKFRLLSPLSGEEFATSPNLSWKAASDPDDQFGDGVATYKVEISVDNEFQVIAFEKNLVDRSVQIESKVLENHLKYFWRATAIDRSSLQTISENVGEFIINSGNQSPALPKLISPGNRSVLKISEPLVFQLGEDPDKNDRLSCEILISEEDNPNILAKILLPDSLLEMARANLLSGIEVSYDNIVQVKLSNFPESARFQDGEWYRFRVNVTDGWGGKTTSDWTTSVFRFDDEINQPPLPPIDGFAPDSVIVQTLYPVIKWSRGTDPDIADRLSYQVILSRDKNFTGRTYIVQSTAYDKTELAIATPLLENSTYFWKVRSIDLEDARSDWSDVHSFGVNHFNEPPFGPVELISPRSLEELSPESCFWWKKTSDPDPGDSVGYILELSEFTDFIQPLISYRIRPGQIVPWKGTNPAADQVMGIRLADIPGCELLKDNTMYYWRIMAIDKQSLASPPPDEMPRIAFNRINNSPTAVVSGFSPRNGEIVATQTPELRWEPSQDPDFVDLHMYLTYELQISQSSQFVDSQTERFETVPGENFFRVPKSLAENQKWFYRVRAKDNHGARSDWSSINSFITNAISEAPLQVIEGFLPKDSMIVDTRKPLISWLPSSDPDPNQSSRDLTYTVKYYPSGEPKKSAEVTTKAGVTSIQLPQLAEDKYYQYQVMAVDPDGKKSAWSKAVIFGINSIDDPPKSFLMLSPFYEEDSVTVDVKFSWDRTIDKDPGGQVTYHLFYGSDSSFVANTTEVILDQSSEKDSVIIYYPVHRFQNGARYFWKLAAVDNSGLWRWASNSQTKPFPFNTIGYRRAQSTVFGPTKFQLHQNYPNPFNTTTRIQYEVPQRGDVDVVMYDMLGKAVKILASRSHSPGIYDVYWDGTDMANNSLPGGMYLCRMSASGFVSHKKVLLMR